MEKSIEDLWKEGFKNPEELAAPKVNEDFFRQKSKLITDGMRRTQKWDTYLAIPLAIIFLITLGQRYSWWLGIYVAALMLVLFFIGIRHLRRQKSLAVGEDVYHYLVNYRNRIQRFKKRWTKIMVIGTPVCIMPVYYFMYFEWSEKGAQALEKLGPTRFGLSVAAVTLFLSVWGGFGYWLSTKALYGRKLKKLDQAIAELEALEEGIAQ